MRNIKFILAIIVGLIAFESKSQSLPYDTLFRPGKYKDLVTKFQQDPIKKTDFVFLGNSITAGGNWSQLLGIPNAKQRGISGDISFGVLERLQEIIDAKPAKVFILIGINDISRNIPDSLIIRNYHQIAERITKGSKRTQIYWYTLLPVNASFQKFKNHYGKDEHILYINEEIRKMASKKLTVIDLYPNFLDEEKHLKSTLTADGLHLIPAGYEVWVKLLKEGGYLK